MNAYKVTFHSDETGTREDISAQRWDHWAGACFYASAVHHKHYPMVEPHPVTVQDTHVDLGAGYRARVTLEPDTDSGPPWEHCDGHGPVRQDYQHAKRPGERVMGPTGSRDVWYLYDFAAAVKQAKAEGWDAPPYNTGTKGEQAVRAAEKDFEFLRSWCNDEWAYVGVCVEVWHGDTQLCDKYDEALWGVEDQGDYWQEVAAERIGNVIREHKAARNAQAARARIERKERAYWAARGMVTV